MKNGMKRLASELLISKIQCRKECKPECLHLVVPSLNC
ncbi:hypothetical protein BDFG_06584 [Blastomyces dermatitidis ATCC 26199]|nr:hypothetical protein BDFG_06584 [Blastomyces dermatitidis ATCC 26199]